MLLPLSATTGRHPCTTENRKFDTPNPLERHRYAVVLPQLTPRVIHPRLMFRFWYATLKCQHRHRGPGVTHLATCICINQRATRNKISLPSEDRGRHTRRRLAHLQNDGGIHAEGTGHEVSRDTTGATDLHFVARAVSDQNAFHVHLSRFTA